MTQHIPQMRARTGASPARSESPEAPAVPPGPSSLPSNADARTAVAVSGEERFREVIELAPDAIVVTGDEGTITLVNRRAEQLFDYARTDLLGQPLHRLMPEWFPETLAGDRDEETPPPTVINQTLMCCKRDGSEFLGAVSLGPLPSDQPADDRREMRLSFIATIRAITIGDDEEREQRARSARLQATVAARHHLAVATSQQGVPASAEASAEALMRLRALADTALAHLKPADLLHELLDGICAVMGMADAGILLLDDDGQHLRLAAACGLEDAVAARAIVPVGQGFSGRIASTRTSLIVNEVPAFETYYPQMRQTQHSAVGVPLLVGDRLVGVIYVGSAAPHQFIESDVALLEHVADRVAPAIERARAYEATEAALDDSEARYRDLVESQVEMVCRYLPDGTLTFVNAAYCCFWGRSREELIGTPFFDLLPAAQADRARANLAHLTQNPDVVSDEHEVVLADGSIAWQQWVEHVILDADGKVVELQAIGRDITDRKRAEMALRESEARFRAAYESAVIGMMLVGPDGHTIQANRALLEMLGYSEEEVQSHPFANFTHPDDLEPNLTLFRQALAGEIDNYQVEKRFLHKQGHIVWGRVSAGVVRDSAGQPLYIVGHLEDITARKRAEQEREAVRAEAELRAEQLDRVFEAMTEGVFVYDAQGRTVRTNLAGRQLIALDAAPPGYFQFSADERVALFQTRDAQGRPLAPDDLPSRRALRGEELTGAHAVEFTSRMFDGREAMLSASAAPLREQDGRIVGAVSVMRDETARKELERARAEQAEQLDRVFEAMVDAVFVYDAQGRTTRTNSAARRLLGLDAAPPNIYALSSDERMRLIKVCDAQGLPLAFDDLPSARAVRGEVLTGAHSVDVVMHTFDGRAVEVNVCAAPLRNPDGSILGGVMILRDQTERNRLVRDRETARASEAAVRAMNQRLDTFSAIAAHDLRQPVAVVKLAVQTAQLQILESAKSAHAGSGKYATLFAQVGAALERADLSLGRLWRLVQQLLDASQARQGRLRLDRKPFSLDELVRQGVREQQQLAPTRTLTLHLPDGLPVVVNADATRLSQVLSNYLANAVRYSFENQPIAVTLRVIGEGAGATARVEVRDQGRGIAPADREKIWAQFQQARNVVESGGSLGLGLYIAKLIVEGHGGVVDVESQVGHGSTFSFTVPLGADEALPDA